MTKKEKRPEATPGMRTPQGQKKRFNLHIDMPHVDLVRPEEAPQPDASVAAVAEVTSKIEVTSIPEAASLAEVTSAPEVTSASAPSISEVTATHDLKPVPIEVTSMPEVTSAAEATIAVEWKNGYLRVPNWMVFNLFPKLDVTEKAAYLELYLRTHGFGRNPHRVSQADVAKSIRVSENTLRATIERLEKMGLVRRLEAQVRGANAARGTLVDVKFPRLLGAPAEIDVTAKPAVTATREVTSAIADMKGKKERHETPATDVPALSVYEIRTIGARLFEAHRGELGFDRERLRELVRDALIGQGRVPDEGAIEEAIRGMGIP